MAQQQRNAGSSSLILGQNPEDRFKPLDEIAMHRSKSLPRMEADESEGTENRGNDDVRMAANPLQKGL